MAAECLEHTRLATSTSCEPNYALQFYVLQDMWTLARAIGYIAGAGAVGLAAYRAGQTLLQDADVVHEELQRALAQREAEASL